MSYDSECVSSYQTHRDLLNAMCRIGYLRLGILPLIVLETVHKTTYRGRLLAFILSIYDHDPAP